jgi:sirohydrochlorin cobaltochelatase
MPTAVADLVARGATRVRVLPLFFGMGKHAREDLPIIMQDLAHRHPGVTLEQLPTAGEDPRLTALLAVIALERAA